MSVPIVYVSGDNDAAAAHPLLFDTLLTLGKPGVLHLFALEIGTVGEAGVLAFYTVAGAGAPKCAGQRVVGVAEGQQQPVAGVVFELQVRPAPGDRGVAARRIGQQVQAVVDPLGNRQPGLVDGVEHRGRHLADAAANLVDVLALDYRGRFLEAAGGVAFAGGVVKGPDTAGLHQRVVQQVRSQVDVGDLGTGRDGIIGGIAGHLVLDVHGLGGFGAQGRLQVGDGHRHPAVLYRLARREQDLIQIRSHLRVVYARAFLAGNDVYLVVGHLETGVLRRGAGVAVADKTVDSLLQPLLLHKSHQPGIAAAAVDTGAHPAAQRKGVQVPGVLVAVYQRHRLGDGRLGMVGQFLGLLVGDIHRLYPHRHQLPALRREERLVQDGLELLMVYNHALAARHHHKAALDEVDVGVDHREAQRLGKQDFQGRQLRLVVLQAGL